MASRNLPGIIKIEYIPIDELTLFPKQWLSPGSTVSAIGNFKIIPTIELSSCNTSSERTSAGLTYTTKITGNVSDCDELTKQQRHILQEKFHAYRLTDVYNNYYLIGEEKKPFPEITFAPIIDGQSSGSRIIPFEITWISALPPIDLVVL